MRESHGHPDTAALRVDLRVYETDAILRAAYRFTDNYYVSLATCEQEKVEVRLASKDGGSIDPRSLAGEFHNELLHCALRREVFRDTKAVRELILGRALFGAVVELDADGCDSPADQPGEADQPSLGGYADDPAGIASDWFAS